MTTYKTGQELFEITTNVNAFMLFKKIMKISEDEARKGNYSINLDRKDKDFKMIYYDKFLLDKLESSLKNSGFKLYYEYRHDRYYVSWYIPIK